MINVSLRSSLTGAVHEVQSWAYVWPAEPDAASTRSAKRGTCAGKHSALAEDLRALGLRSEPLMVVGPLVPHIWADLAQEGADLLEVHECLTVETSWAGPLLLDVTWHPAAIRAGLRGSLDWDGTVDMVCAVDIRGAHAVGAGHFREQKEALRSRLYTQEQRGRRDALLREMAVRAGLLNDQTRAPTTSDAAAPDLGG